MKYSSNISSLSWLLSMIFQSIPCLCARSAPRNGCIKLACAAAIAATLATLAAPASPASAASLLYSNDFDALPTLAPGVTAGGFTNGGLEAANTFGSWTGNYFANRSMGDPAVASVLTLSNLPAHSAVNISFILGFLESWDSSNPSPWSPDYLKIEVDGSTILDLLTISGAVNYGGGTILADYVQANAQIYFSDTLIDMAPSSALLSIPHSANSLSLSINAYGAGWQGGTDEAWGLDALTITYVPADSPNPVPGPLPLLGLITTFKISRKIRRRLTLAGPSKT
jgi:hypothetical protein